ncbi:glycosyltransferase [Pseudomonas umsongensis]|uniref:glycosyltransferase n=1 Tax=Pseudomonas umsongensis TaxID=198618 RepID=UPI00124665DC|nr:glycosyltransferase [Pseudomonas umsongensis]QFG28872.1 glycosyltransferase [Pseudomonas umsongensis]
MDHFHRDRQAGLHDSAEAHLERALHTPEYRSEALIWKGIEALQQKDPQRAFVYLSGAAHQLPQRTDVRALLARSLLAQNNANAATRLLSAAWRDQPHDPTLRMALWQARSQSEQPARLCQLILAHLPEINDSNELKLVLGLLTALPNAPKNVGVVHYDPESGEIRGWALNLRAPQTPLSLQLQTNGCTSPFLADSIHPLLQQAGLSANHGGIQVQVSQPTPELHIRFKDGAALLGSPLSVLPPFVPPTPVAGNVARQQPVDVLIPVYEGLAETLECIDSVLRNRSLNQTEHRLVVLDDASPNRSLSQALKKLAASGQIHYVRQPTNLGFIRNTNRGMALSPERDVVWLNADTRVNGNWLDRLRAVAYEAENIASVTPFTNNGELMSFPLSRVSQAMPSAEQQAQLDHLASQTDSAAVEIETGCGFCLYIKRSALDEVGYLDEVHLSRGYGEETDWCLRARAFGWRHMGAPRVFVAHQGGISFGDEKVLRVAHNNAILRRRYPDAESRYTAFCLRDPLQPARQALQRARFAQLRSWMITEQQGQACRQLSIEGSAPSTAPLILKYQNRGQHTRVTLQAALQPLSFTLDYRLPNDAKQLLSDLQSLPLDELVYQQLAGCPAELRDLPAQLQRPYQIICSDDTLLAEHHNLQWRHFASQAQSVRLAWNSMQARYATALPEAQLALPTKRTNAPGKNPVAPRTLLIADRLEGAELAQRWLDLGRSLNREKLPYLLLVIGDGPWLAPLISTGAVQTLVQLPGLSIIDTLAITGCTAALSLDPTPNSSWSAVAKAAEYGLPLYAEASDIAREADILPLDQLPPLRNGLSLPVNAL